MGYYQCQDLATTRQQIEDAGLRVGSISVDPADGPQEYDDAYLVISQTPEAGRPVARGRRIFLLLVDPSGHCP